MSDGAHKDAKRRRPRSRRTTDVRAAEPFAFHARRRGAEYGRRRSRGHEAAHALAGCSTATDGTLLRQVAGGLSGMHASAPPAVSAKGVGILRPFAPSRE